MTRRAFGMFALALVLVCAGCGVFTSYPTVRYRLSVEVETPSGLRTGSSVIQVSCSSSNTGIGWATGTGCQTKGEAVVIDLPGGRTLFALLTRSGEVGSGGSYAFSAFPSNLQHNDFGGTVTELAAKTGVAELPRHAETPNVRHAETDPPTAYPAFVTFKNLNDSKSVVAVDPDHFDVIFGKGMRLKRITVQITKDPVTTGIEKRLKWLVEYGRRGSRLNGSNDAAIKTNDLSDNLSVGAFSTMLR